MPATVLLLDLDGFKEVNDTLGHSAGDAVLKEVAIRLASLCTRASILARLGGDEFVILLAGNSERTAYTTARRLVEGLSRPYEFLGQTAEIGLSIGMALAPMHGTNSEDLLGAADLALYKAKAAGKGRYELFKPALRDVASARRVFERELRLAFENGQFELYYQPQVALKQGVLTGAEALIRWHHPTRGLLSPASFIDVLAMRPWAPAVGEWILRTACGEAAKWRTLVPDFRIGVNLFDVQLQSRKIITFVQEVLVQTGLPAHSLELELVETIFLRSDRTTLGLLHRLREMGLGLAFDDYGTGYAALSFLKRYPVTRLKIDRSFVRNVDKDQANAAVVRAIIGLGQSFGFAITAEGVETETERDFLLSQGCAEAQGYLLGRPASAEVFAAKYVRRPR